METIVVEVARVNVRVAVEVLDRVIVSGASRTSYINGFVSVFVPNRGIGFQKGLEVELVTVSVKVGVGMAKFPKARALLP